MPTLYELADAREILDRVFAENEGELTHELEVQLDALSAAVDDKIERVALYIKERLNDCEAIRAEEVRLAARRHAVFNGAESLREYLKRQMERLGKTKVNGLLCTISLKETAITVEGDLPQDALERLYEQDAPFVKYKPAEFSIDKTTLNKYVREGHVPPEGTRIADTTTYITIR